MSHSKQARKTTCTWLALLLAAGCSSGNGDPAAAGAGGTPAAGTTVSGGGGMSGSSGGAPTGGAGGVGVITAESGAGGSGMGGASAGVAAPDAGGATPSTCEDPGDFSGPQLRDCNLPGACGACMWEKACASFQFRCAKDAGCVCMAECVAVAGVNATQGCFTQCGLTESPPGFAEWVKGASDMCWDEGCGTLAAPVDDPGATTGGSTGAGTELDCAFDTTLSHDPCGAVLQLQSADGSVCARVERREDGPGTDANTSWTLLDVRIGPLGQVCHVDDVNDLCWFSSHHNYADWAHVTCGDLHYDLNIGKNCGKLRNPASTYRLHVFEGAPADGTCAPTADGACPVVEPIDLFPIP